MNHNETLFLFGTTRGESLSKRRDSNIAALLSSQVENLVNCVSRCLKASFSNMAFLQSSNREKKKELRVLPVILKKQGAQFLAKLPYSTKLWATIEDT